MAELQYEGDGTHISLNYAIILLLYFLYFHIFVVVVVERIV